MSLLDRFRRKQTKERLQTLGKTQGGETRTTSSTQAAKPAEEKKRTAQAPAVSKAPSVKKPHKQDGISETAFRVLLRELITEKSTAAAKHRHHVFAVHPDANKTQIRNAVAEVYGTIPKKVRMISMRGKAVRYGRHSGRRKDWKKAIVILREGASLHPTE